MKSLVLSLFVVCLFAVAPQAEARPHIPRKAAKAAKWVATSPVKAGRFAFRKASRSGGCSAGGCAGGSCK